MGNEPRPTTATVYAVALGSNVTEVSRVDGITVLGCDRGRHAVRASVRFQLEDAAIASTHGMPASSMATRPTPQWDTAARRSAVQLTPITPSVIGRPRRFDLHRIFRATQQWIYTSSINREDLKLQQTDTQPEHTHPWRRHALCRQ